MYLIYGNKYLNIRFLRPLQTVTPVHPGTEEKILDWACCITSEPQLNKSEMGNKQLNSKKSKMTHSVNVTQKLSKKNHKFASFFFFFLTSWPNHQLSEPIRRLLEVEPPPTAPPPTAGTNLRSSSSDSALRTRRPSSAAAFSPCRCGC